MPGFLLRRCHQISVGFFLDECRGHGLTPVQFAVLNALIQEGPQDQISIGRSAALDRSTTARVVKGLEADGHVVRGLSTKDRRALVVSITNEGRKLVADILPAILKAQERMLAAFEPEEREQFLKLLNKFAENNNEQSRAPMRSG